MNRCGFRGLRSIWLFAIAAVLLLPVVSNLAGEPQDYIAAQAPELATGVVSGTYFNPLQVGLLFWHGGSQPANFTVGSGPQYLAFDLSSPFTWNSTPLSRALPLRGS